MVDEGAAKALSTFQVEDEVFTAGEERALRSAKIVVPSKQYPTVLDALEHARAPEERRDGRALQFDEEDLDGCSIFIKRGIHNISEAPELTLCKAVAVTAQTGAVLAAYAFPRQESVYPEYGGGRLRLEEEASGSVFKGLEWWSDNVQCAIVDGAAVLFAECRLKCKAGAYVSCIWGMQGAHISMVNCTVGGFDKEQQASYGIVASGSVATLERCLLHYCSGSTVMVESNGTARISSCELLDSFAAVSVSDDRLHDGPSQLPGCVELVNSTVKCVEGIWRDEDRPRHYVERDVTVLEQDYPELAHYVNQPYPHPQLEWNAEREEWEYAGASDTTLARHQAYFDKYSQPDQVNMTEVHRRIRAQRATALWDSSEEEDGDGGRKLVRVGAEEEEAGKDVIGFDVRNRHDRSVLRDLRPRYKNSHGHEGLPPRQRNRHFAGVLKNPRVKRAGRHTYKK